MNILLLIIILFYINSIMCYKGKKNKMLDFQITWQIDSITSIGGYTPVVLGLPRVVSTPGGKMVEFDGEGDGLQIDTCPLEGAGTFTLEVIFRPDAGGLPEQRFFHLQEDGSDNRVLIETRLTGDGRWYLDTFIRSGMTDQTLIDSTLTHPVGEWYNAALVYDGREMRHYVNGEKELTAVILSYTPLEKGKTSIGVRINRVYWFKGAIRTVRFTASALSPGDFLKP